MNLKKNTDLLLVISSFAIFFAAIATYYIYRKIFNGELSNELSDWGAIGSFFGGIFSPLISFLTLLALIITIKLQREMLKTQSLEFSKLHVLQQQALSIQNNQLIHLKTTFDNDNRDKYKQSILTVINQQLELHQKVIDRAEKAATYLIEQRAKTGQNFTGKIEENLATKEKAEIKANELASLSVTIAIKKYSCIEDIDRDFIAGYASDTN